MCDLGHERPVATKGIARELLHFAVRLYTRLTPAPHAKIAKGFRFLQKEETLHIDNGERMITVIIKYGPFWDEDEESA